LTLSPASWSACSKPSTDPTLADDLRKQFDRTGSDAYSEL
jgi:hypothetical protein